MKLQSLSNFCGALNLAGLLQLEYAPTDWVNSTQFERILSDGYNFQKDIVFNTGGWLTAPVLPSKQIWNETERPNNQGSYYKQNINVIVPQLRSEVSGEFLKMKTHTYILRITDANSRKWLIGSLESPFIFRRNGTTGKKNGDLANYELTFDCETKYPATGFVPVF